jgi:hypothetical protein
VCCPLYCFQVVLRNVSVNYVDPSDIDTPEQYNAKVRRHASTSDGNGHHAQQEQQQQEQLGQCVVSVACLSIFSFVHEL